MMGSMRDAQAALFHEFSLEDDVSEGRLLRSIDRFVDLNGIRKHLQDFYSHSGRPPVGANLLIRMLLVGHCFPQSERRLCDALRHLFETTVARCTEEGLVCVQRMAIYAGLTEADHGVNVELDVSRSMLQAESGSTKTMQNRVQERFDQHS